MLLRVPRSTVIQSNATTGQDFAGGDSPVNSDFGYRDVTNYSHANTVNAQMPALQTSTYPYTANLGQLGLHGGSTTHMFSDSHSGSTTRVGPSMGPTDNTFCSASNVTWGAQALYDHRPNGQNALLSSHNSQTSLPMFGTGSGGSQGCMGLIKTMKPGTYDGSGGWTDYLVQFNLFADHNNWDNRLRAINLAMNLRGTAQNVLSDLGKAQRGDFGALVSALSARFEPVHQSEIFKTQVLTSCLL